MARGLQATLAACLALGSLASAAQARTIVFGGTPLTAEFRVAGSHDYRVGIYASRDRVTVFAARRHAASYYEAKGRVTPRGVEARLGRYGRIAVSFRERSVKRVPSRTFGCSGGPEVVRSGVFVGTIRFRGEGGYTRVAARRARGRTTVSPRWRCSGGRGGDLTTPDQVVLAAGCGRGGFSVVGHRSVDKGPRVFPDEDTTTSFLAAFLERRGRMRVVRVAFVRSGRRAFLFDEAFSFATVEPPAPFHGVGRLVRDPSGAGSWEGTLSVDLPGRTVDLIDPRYRIALVRYRQERLDGKYVLPPRVACPAANGAQDIVATSDLYGAGVIGLGGP